jgi:hypothetical protein
MMRKVLDFIRDVVDVFYCPPKNNLKIKLKIFNKSIEINFIDLIFI